ncbi:V-type ATPase subunit [Candidatus Bathyarchaeota archaeon]|nr:V-type ATPase subunit [Candidatus Bathyarchaeota archaeon]
MARDTLSHLVRDNFLIALMRGKRSQFLDRQQLISLAESKSQNEIIGLLSEGSYGLELSKLTSESSPIETERAIRLGFARSVRSLITASRGDTHDFLMEYRRRFDAYDLAGLVIFKAQHKSWEEYLATRQPLGLMKEQELHRLYSLDDLPTIASSAGDRHLVDRLKGFSMEDGAGDKASLLRDTINGWGEERFYKYIDDELSGADRENCRPLAGSTIDIANLTIILRSKILGATGIKDHMISSHWKLNQRSIEQLLAATDVAQALDAAAAHDYYYKVLAGARQKYEESESLAFIEVALRLLQLKLSTRLFLGFPYSVGIVLAFLVLKENEAKNLGAVLTGVGAGLPSDSLRSLLAVQD